MRTSGKAAVRTFVAVTAIAFVAAACGDSTTETTATTAAPPATDAPPTTAAPATTAPATTAAPATTSAPATTAAPPTTVAAPATTATPATTAPLLPEVAVLTQGGTVVAVYLQIVSEGEMSGNLNDDFADVIARAADLGYFVGNGDLNCDQGAADALGLAPGNHYGAAVYFETMEEANAFAAVWDGEVAGIVTVITFCLD